MKQGWSTGRVARIARDLANPHAVHSAFRSALGLVVFTAIVYQTQNRVYRSNPKLARDVNTLFSWAGIVSILVSLGSPVLGRVSLAAAGFIVGGLLGGLLAFLTTLNIRAPLSICLCFVVALVGTFAGSCWQWPPLGKIATLSYTVGSVYVLMSDDQYALIGPVFGILAGALTTVLLSWLLWPEIGSNKAVGGVHGCLQSLCELSEHAWTSLELQVLAAELRSSQHGTARTSPRLSPMPSLGPPWVQSLSDAGANDEQQQQQQQPVSIDEIKRRQSPNDNYAGLQGAQCEPQHQDGGPVAEDEVQREERDYKERVRVAEAASEDALLRFSNLVLSTKDALGAAATELYVAKWRGHCLFLPSLLLWKHKNHHMPAREIEATLLILRKIAVLLWTLQLTFRKGFEPEMLQVMHMFRTVGMLQRMKDSSVGFMRDLTRCFPQKCGQRVDAIPETNLQQLRETVRKLMRSSAERHYQMVSHARKFAGMATPQLLSSANSLCTNLSTAASLGAAMQRCAAHVDQRGDDSTCNNGHTTVAASEGGAATGKVEEPKPDANQLGNDDNDSINSSPDGIEGSMPSRARVIDSFLFPDTHCGMIATVHFCSCQFIMEELAMLAEELLHALKQILLKLPGTEFTISRKELQRSSDVKVTMQ